MSRYVTQDDGLFVQVVANAFNLTIHINESIPGFASVTNISRVSSETDTTVRNIGHINETHYFSTVPFNEETLVSNVIHNNECMNVSRISLDEKHVSRETLDCEKRGIGSSGQVLNIRNRSR